MLFGRRTPKSRKTAATKLITESQQLPPSYVLCAPHTTLTNAKFPQTAVMRFWYGGYAVSGFPPEVTFTEGADTSGLLVHGWTFSTVPQLHLGIYSFHRELLARGCNNALLKLYERAS